MRALMWIGVVVLGACGGGDGGGSGTVSADVVLDGEAIDFAQGCTMPDRTDDWNVYASGGDPHLGFDLIWGKDAIDAAGTYEIDVFAGISFYVEIDDAIHDAEGEVTFDTYAPEDGAVSGSFDVTVVRDQEEPLLTAAGDFDCN